MSTLTTVSGVNYALRTAVPPTEIPSYDNYGRLRVLHDRYVLATGDNFGTAGLIRMFIIPKGAKVFDSIFCSADLGTTGLVDVGWAASADGAEVADADSLFAQADLKTATVVAVRMTGLTAGFNHLMLGSAEAQVDFTEASDGSGSRTIALTTLVSVE